MGSVGVPTRIVMAGTSTIKLHERFSKLPAPKARKMPRGAPVSRRNASRIIGTYGRGEYEDDMLEDEEMLDEEEVEYVEQPVRSRQANLRLMRALTQRLENQRQMILKRRVPIEHRLTVPAKPKVIYVNGNQQNNRRGFFRGGMRRGGGQSHNNNSYNNYQNNNTFRSNDGLPRYNRGTFKRGGSRGGFQNRGGFVKRGGYQNNNFQQQQKKTTEQLDRELEEYMKKQKHPRISA